MEEVKEWWQSKAIWGGVAAAVASSAGLFGCAVDAVTQRMVADGMQQAATNAMDIYTAAVSLVGAVVAIYGRIKANKAIGKRSE